MEIIKGRNFDKTMKTDSGAVILNEEAVRLFGYEQNTLKESIYESDENTTTQYKIIGVVKNFNFESLRKNIGPLALFLNPRKNSVGFKLGNTANAQSIISQIETEWKSLANGAPFAYRFLDESFDEMYRSEQRIGKIALIFSILAIFIACLGLFGLASFIAEQRTKELGVRKVLGAGVGNLIALLSKDFIRLVLIAFFIAIPISWYTMNKWLQDFEYRVSLSWWMFALAGILTLAIALLTVSSQAIKAAVANPSNSLRSE